MKQRYTITVANSEIYIITEEPKEALDTIVGVVDRRIREIHLHSRSCSRVDAALILCLEYCAEKLKLQKKLKQANAEIERLTVLNEAAERANASLEREIETLRASLNMSPSPKSSSKKTTSVQLGFDDFGAENEPLTIIAEHAEDQKNSKEDAKKGDQEIKSAIDEILSGETDTSSVASVLDDEEKESEIASEKLTPPAEEPSKKSSAKAKKKKVRAMFDMISFDDI